MTDVIIWYKYSLSWVRLLSVSYAQVVYPPAYWCGVHLGKWNWSSTAEWTESRQDGNGKGTQHYQVRTVIWFRSCIKIYECLHQSYIQYIKWCTFHLKVTARCCTLLCIWGILLIQLISLEEKTKSRTRNWFSNQLKLCFLPVFIWSCFCFVLKESSSGLVCEKASFHKCVSDLSSKWYCKYMWFTFCLIFLNAKSYRY